MKFIKKTLAYIVPATMLFTAASCSDFIDIEPENTLPDESVDYSDTENMYAPVIGVYSQLRTSGMHWANALMWFSHDGDMWSGRTDDQGAAVTFGRNFQYDNSFWAVNNVWVTMYEIVRTANSALESLDGYAAYLTPGSSEYETYESYCGEVRTLRAWAYYQLATSFGPVPLYTDNLQTEFRRATLESVYNYIHTDLEYAASKLPELRPNEMAHQGAVTAFTAKMLDAKVYLQQGNYSKVESLTNDIINSHKFTLYSDYYQLFKIPGKLCDESLLECQVTDYGLGSGDYVGVDQWFNFMGPTIRQYELDPVTGEKVGEPITTFGGWNFLGYEPEFVAWADQYYLDNAADPTQEDVRAVTSFLRANQALPETGWFVRESSGTMTDCWNGKGYLPYDQLTPGRTTYGQNNNVRILRYAEVLLMNAEARTRNGSADAAYGYNEVRKRAGLTEKTSPTVDEILDEKRMELCSEWGIRYNDLVRTGKAATVLGPKGWTTDKTFWPVPSTQLQNLPDLALDPVEQ